MKKVSDDSSLQGKFAILTGAGSGIGRATAVEFARRGAAVCVADISVTGLNETLEIISRTQKEENLLSSRRSSTSRHFSVGVDVSNEAEIKKMVQFAVSNFGRLDIIFNNAGIYEWFSVEDTPTEIWDKIISTNLRGAFLGTKYAAPHLKKTRGVIVNTSSSLGFAGVPESSAYCASKAGIIGLTKASALDLAKYGVRVNCICPGSIDTKMQAKEFARSGRPNAMRKAYNKIYPLGRIGKAEEVAKLVAFLASDQSSFITGTAMLIDGGVFAQWGESLAHYIMR